MSCVSLFFLDGCRYYIGNTQNRAFYLTLRVIYAIFGHPIDVFEFLVFLEKSRVALRQVTGALLQNNVRHRRIFLDITNQDLMQENLNSQNT